MLKKLHTDSREDSGNFSVEAMAMGMAMEIATAMV